MAWRETVQAAVAHEVPARHARFDPFWAANRKNAGWERSLITQYEADMRTYSPADPKRPHDAIVALADLPPQNPPALGP